MGTQLSRSASLMGFFELVKSLEGDPEDVLSLVGIPPFWLESDDYLIPSVKLIELLERAAEQLNCPDFGMRLASLQKLTMLGPVGLLVQQCDTLGDALKQLKQFLHVHSQAGLLDVNVQGDLAYITFEPLVDYQGQARQLIDLSLVAGLNIMNDLVEQTIRPSSAYFSYREPKALASYHHNFHCPLTFEREVSGVAVPSRLLDLPLLHERGRIKDFVRRFVHSIEQANPLQLEDRLRVLIRQLMPLGQCNILQVCTLMQVDVRTLQRRLNEKGTSYQSILTDERKQLAKRYLKESDVSISHLADLLGFAEVSVFSRSFKQWTGMTPTQFLRAESTRLKYR